MAFLLTMITERATATFDASRIVDGDLKPWYRHWFGTAAIFRAEMEAQGLVKTVAAIDDLVTEQLKFARLERL
jgi:hypothetical protein